MQPQGNRPTVGRWATATFAGGTLQVPPARARQLAAGISLHPRGFLSWPYLTGADATSAAPEPVVVSRLVGRAAAGPRPRGQPFAAGCQRPARSPRVEAAWHGPRRRPRVSQGLGGVRRATQINSWRGINAASGPREPVRNVTRAVRPGSRSQRAAGSLRTGAKRWAPLRALPPPRPLPRPALGAAAFLPLFLGAAGPAVGVPDRGDVGGGPGSLFVSPQKLENPPKALWSHSSGGESARGENSNKSVDSRLQCCWASR